jgi:hypothetical protein
MNDGSKFVIDFSVDGFNEIEYCDLLENDGIVTTEECETFLKKLVDDEIIEVNERSKGQVIVVNKMVYLDYETCTQLGEDWVDDEWEDRFKEVPISEVM